MKWNQDGRRRKGGYWRCAVTARTVDRNRRRARYNNDPIWRIAHRLKRDAQARRQRLNAAHERLELMRGSLSP